MLQINLYNPGTLSKEILIDNFIIRKEEFDRIFYEIEHDDMKNPPQHFIIQAQRGNGKTTLLWRLYYEVENNRKLNKWLLPVIFNEEEYRIRTLYKLWEAIAEYLEESKESCFKGIANEMEQQENDENYERKCYKILKKYLKENNNKIVVFIDNIGDILKRFNDDEEHRFREILMTD